MDGKAIGAGLLHGLNRLRVRRRRRRVAEALAIALAVVACAVLAALLLMDQARFAPMAVTAARALVYAATVLSLLVLVLPRALERFGDAQASRYAERHAPDLDALVQSALESMPAATVPESRGASAALARRLVTRAGGRLTDLDPGAAFERRRTRRAVLAGLAIIFAVVLAVLSGPDGFRHGAALLWLPGADRAANPYRIELTPGGVTVVRGADLAITARARGFEPESMELFTRSDGGGEWRSVAMTPGSSAGAFEAFLFDLEASADYYASGGGVQSPRFRLDVVQAPVARRIDLVYHYPARSGRAPETVVGGGDISAVAGTRVEVRVYPDPALSSGRLRLDGDHAVEMKAKDDALVAILDIVRSGHYRVELPAFDGSMLAASPEYAIEAVADALPEVAISRPGRDINVSSVEEIEFDVLARDDIAVRSLDLVLWVNGDAEETFPLHRDASPAPEIEARHVLYLEDRALAPGDLVAYYVRAADDAGDPERAISSDIFFMEVRPFDRKYRRARGGGAGGAGGQGIDDALAAQQRRLVIALFKLQRDRDGFSESALSERLQALSSAQARIRDRVDAISRRLAARNILHMAPALEQMAEALPKASSAMLRVEALLAARDVDLAMPPARTALLHLQRADAAFREIQVAQGSRSGGGGDAANDLSNLFRLEMDKLRTQYEHVQRGRAAPPDQRLDEAIRKLRALARRQQRELDRQARRDAAGMGASAAQGELAERVDRVLRELERLTRRRPGEDLDAAMGAVREAAEAMRRGDGLQDSRTALEQLREAERLLERGRRDGLVKGIEAALRKTESLARQQASVRGVLDSAPSAASVAEVVERKSRMVGDVHDLETEIERLAADARRHGETASELNNGREAIEAGALADRIERTRRLLDADPAAATGGLEAGIARTLERVRESVANARSAAVDAAGERSRSLAALRSLVRSQDHVQQRLVDEARAQRNTLQGSSAGAAPEDVDNGAIQRQFAEAGRRLQALGPALQPPTVDTARVGEIVDALRALDASSSTSADLAVRHAEILDMLKALERQVRPEAPAGEPTLIATERIEPGDAHRALADEYFRRLSEDGAGPDVKRPGTAGSGP